MQVQRGVRTSKGWRREEAQARKLSARDRAGDSRARETLRENELAFKGFSSLSREIDVCCLLPWQRRIEFLRLNFKRNNFVRPFNLRRLLRQRLPGEYIFSASQPVRRFKKNREKLFNVVEWRMLYDTSMMNYLLVTLLVRLEFNVEFIKKWRRRTLCTLILLYKNSIQITILWSVIFTSSKWYLLGFDVNELFVQY